MSETKQETDCPHRHIVKDSFAEFPGVFRLVPGDCFCSDCGEPVEGTWKPEEQCQST